MSTSRIEYDVPRGIRVTTTSDALAVDLADGRTVTAPLAWYPRLLHATVKERKNWRWIGWGRNPLAGFGRGSERGRSACAFFW